MYMDCDVTSYEGDDTIETGGGNDVVDAGDDKDVIRTRGGADTIFAGAHQDLINPGPGPDTVYGEGGPDLIRSYDDPDVDLLDAGPGRDRVCTLGANDELHAGTHPGSGDDETLYISEYASGGLPNPYTSTANANTECGHSDWNASGDWAGASCDYSLGTPPAACPVSF